MLEIILEPTIERIAGDVVRSLDAHARGVLSDEDLMEMAVVVTRANVLLQRLEQQLTAPHGARVARR